MMGLQGVSCEVAGSSLRNFCEEPTAQTPKARAFQKKDMIKSNLFAWADFWLCQNVWLTNGVEGEKIWNNTVACVLGFVSTV
jgi:hypothetical protein